MRRRRSVATGAGPVAARARAAGALLAALATLAVAGCGVGEPPVPGSTTETTLRDLDGDGALEPGPGQPLVPRTELAAARPTDRTLAVFAQLTDSQVGDEESPARLPVLDRLGPPLNAAFRPQEALTPHVLDAAVRSVNSLDPQAVVLTGDLIENAQENEMDLLLAVLRGGRVDPASGRRAYDGPQSADNADPLLYRPDVDAPRYAGLLRRAQRPFRAEGLRAPWYPVVGNHDLLVQGVVAPTPRTNAVATGDRAVVEIDGDADLPRSEQALSPDLVDRVLAGGVPGRSIRVPPDPRRRELSAAGVIARLRAASGQGGRGPGMEHAFDLGSRARGIVLDVARRDSGTSGRVAPAQLRWLRRELRRAGRRHVVVFSHQPLASSEGGDRALALLDRHPRVVAAVSGSTHRNVIEPRRTRAGGYWLVSTSSLVDHPQQARAFRLVETARGGVALETWMLDHAGTGDTPAGASRALAFIDAQGGRPRGTAGRPGDRNARLFR